MLAIAYYYLLLFFCTTLAFVNISFYISIGPMDVRANGKGEERQGYKNLRKALCVGYANQLAERKIHHNGYRTLGFKAQVVQVLIINNFRIITLMYATFALIDYPFHVLLVLILFLL